MIKIYTIEKKTIQIDRKAGCKNKMHWLEKTFSKCNWNIKPIYPFFAVIKQTNNHIFKRFIFLLQPFDTSFRAFRTRNTNMIWIICKMHFTFCYTLHSFLVVLFYFSFFFFVYLFDCLSIYLFWYICWFAYEVSVTVCCISSAQRSQSTFGFSFIFNFFFFFFSYMNKNWNSFVIDLFMTPGLTDAGYISSVIFTNKNKTVAWERSNARVTGYNDCSYVW